MKTFRKVMDGITFVEKVIMAILIAVVSLVAFGNVVSRYLMPEVPWSFTEELVINMFVPLSLLGAAVLAREEGGLIGMALFTGFLPRKGQRIMNIVMVVFGLFFCYVMITTGYTKAVTDFTMNKLTYVLRMPIGIFTATIPVCGALMAMHLVEFAIENIYYIVKGEDPETEVDA